jgi:hypothetical protein
MVATLVHRLLLLKELDPWCLEAMASREAIALAADLLVSKITVVSDCMDVVKGLHGRHTWVHTAIS